MDKDIERTLRFFRLTTHDEPIRRVCVQGSLFHFLCHGYYHPDLKPPENHEIKTFSPKARLRLLQTSESIAWDSVPRSLFTTWTYPDQALPRGRAQRNNDRYLLHRGIENVLRRRVAAIWRVEYKQRLSGPLLGEWHPHWHIIWVDIGYVPYREIRLVWKKICHTDQEIEMDFEPVFNHKKACIYMSKYVAKMNDQPRLDRGPQLNTDGRHYGFLRKDMIPRQPKTWYEQLTERQAKELRRFAGMLLTKLNPCANISFKMMGKFAELMKGKIAEMGLQPVDIIP